MASYPDGSDGPRYWQVRTDMLSGGLMLFGVRADDREAAQAKVLLLTTGIGASGVQMTEIPLPADRKEQDT
jgi:hypothetical protein